MLNKLCLVLGLAIVFTVGAAAQTTAFTYQGSLKDGAAAANGDYDFEFGLFDAASGGSQLGSTLTRNNVAVANGIFSVSLDFGNQFSGADRFLEIRVRLVGQPGLTTLTPRQLVKSSPYSVRSLNSSNADAATNATQLGGVAASQYVLTTDPRMNDARPPTPGSSNYIQNTPFPQASSTFYISGDGTIGNDGGVGGRLRVGGPPGGNIYRLYVTDPLNHGLRVETASPGGNVASFGGNGNFSVDGPGTFGGRFTILENGNTGIGIFAPQFKLHVMGQDVRVEGDNTGIFPRYSLNFTGGAADAKKWQNYATTDALIFSGINDAESIENRWMQVTRSGLTTTGIQFPNGNVSIGSSSLTPDRLGVNGTVSLLLGTGGTTQLCRNASFQISTCSSSMRYKSDVADLKDGYGFVSRLRPVSFTWYTGSKTDIGLIAEEVAEIDPRFVTYNDKGEVEGVKYDRLSVAFVNAFKEQQAQIESQRSLIDKQQAVIEQLEKRLEQLEKK